MEQVIIALSGEIAIWLSQDSAFNRRRWASVIGLIGQPFWLHSTFAASQWGMFALSVFYTVGWCKGLYLHWLKPKH